ncbi:NAD(P)H-dependent oxidoreductase [Sphingomonas sp. PAMC 26605]|uniref:NAD(P)H-dependent oxidoreductase n=1 Tax=Sphingomonas sp. PAMC 26605 TaxID=1112214 RepID=UPI00026CAC7E|nr:NAD(P)H-dependent oxidoreductase [Sphingomonas sp. PAMC 26605]
MTIAAPSADPSAIRHIIVLGTPSATSFTHAVAETYRDAVRDCGQHASLRDLYAMRFNPLLGPTERPTVSGHALLPDVAAELALLEGAAVIAFVYPLWVGMPPAIIKGYIHRVLGAGFREPDLLSGTQVSLLHGKRLLGFSASASTRPWLEEHGQWASIRQGIDSYLASVFGLVDGGHVHFDSIVEGVPEHYVRECLAEVRETARRTCAAVLSERHARRNDARRLLLAQ